jgi:hypothetical protein
VAGIVVHFIGARNGERRRNAWLTEGKEIEPPWGDHHAHLTPPSAG